MDEELRSIEAPETTFQSSLTNKISSSDIIERRIVYNVQSILTYDSSFEAEGGIRFTEASTAVIDRLLQKPAKLHGLSVQSSRWLACRTTYMLAFSGAV